MSGLYGHATETMLEEIDVFLTRAWETALQQRVAPSRRSAVPVLNAALIAYRDSTVTPLFSQGSPEYRRARLSG